MQTETQRKIENLKKIDTIQLQQLQQTRNHIKKLESITELDRLEMDGILNIHKSINHFKRPRTHLNVVYITSKGVYNGL